MDRRKFLLATVVGVSAVAVPTFFYYSRVPEYDHLLSEPEILSHIWDNKTIHDIGQSYMKQFPTEKSERILVSLLSENTQSGQTIITHILRRQISDDFTKGDIVKVDGWLLSRTEARQCALFSLTHKN